MSSFNTIDHDNLSSYSPSMFTLNPVDRDDLPSYDEATNSRIPPQPTTTRRISREYLFYRGNGLTTRPKVRSSDGNRSHTLHTNISSSRSSTISIHLASTRSPVLGTLVFPATHNDFQIHLPNPEAAPPPILLTQVKARIGNPHPTTYHFVLPANSTSKARNVVWTIHRTVSTSKNSNICYTLTNETTNEPLAFWTTVQGSSHSAILRWQVPPQNDREELIVLSSFIGCMSRLRLKGKEKLDGGSGTVRWNGMWFGAVLGTAAMS